MRNESIISVIHLNNSQVENLELGTHRQCMVYLLYCFKDYIPPPPPIPSCSFELCRIIVHLKMDWGTERKRSYEKDPKKKTHSHFTVNEEWSENTYSVDDFFSFCFSKFSLSETVRGSTHKHTLFHICVIRPKFRLNKRNRKTEKTNFQLWIENDDTKHYQAFRSTQMRKFKSSSSCWILAFQVFWFYILLPTVWIDSSGKIQGEWVALEVSLPLKQNNNNPSDIAIAWILTKLKTSSK